MYEQVKTCVKENILGGTLKVNDALPSVRQLAKELNVSTITTKRAYIDLEHEGLIYTISGKGTFVKAVDVSKLLTERNKALLQEYENKTIEMKEAGITKEDIINIIEKVYRG
jgi:GntR family transcriptional regulator